MTTNLPFLRWLVAHPAVRAGETTTAFLVEHPPLSQPPVTLAPRRGETPFRLNLPPPPPAPPPDLAAAGRARRRDAEHSEIAAPMPGTVLRVLVAAGRHGRGAGSRSSCSRR